MSRLFDFSSDVRELVRHGGILQDTYHGTKHVAVPARRYPKLADYALVAHYLANGYRPISCDELNPREFASGLVPSEDES